METKETVSFQTTTLPQSRICSTHLLAQSSNRLFNLHQVHLFRVPQHRRNQPLWRRNRNRHIHIIPKHQAIALNLRVHGRNRLHRRTRRLDKRRHEAQADAVFLLDIVFPLFPELDEVGHVDFVEGG
jgi:hypothetical protein